MLSQIGSSVTQRSLRKFQFRCSRLLVENHRRPLHEQLCWKNFSSTIAAPSSRPRFDRKLATILGAYSFEAYNDSFIGKPALGLDHTKVYFSSLQHIRNLFDGAVIVTVKRVKLMKSHEKQFAERLVSGSNPDPYIISSVYERYSENPYQNRLLDSARSSTKRNTLEAEWFGKGALAGRDGESFALYLRDTNTTTLEFSVFDEEVFSVDEFLGNAVLSFQELKNIMQQRENSSGLAEMNYVEDYDMVLPIYVDQYRDKTKESLFQSLKAFATSKPDKERVQVGTLTVSAKYLPWSILSDEQISNLVVLGETDVIESSSINNATNSNIILDTWEQLRKKKPSDWSQFLTKTIQRQLPSLPMPSDMLNPTDGNILNHTSLALQQLQQKIAARNENVENNSGSLENSVYQEASIALHDKALRFQTAYLPRGAMPNIADWSVLLQHLLNEQTQNTIDGKDDPRVQKLINSLLRGQMHQISLIDNPDTDTQVSIWADASTKSVIVSFRGTELVRIKDVLTDINMLQAPFRPDHPELSRVKVHLGFLKAYDSVQLTLLQQLHDIATWHWQSPDTSTAKENDPWSIFVTGHSLGGALATLFAFDLARIRAGMYNLSSIDDWEVEGRSPPWYSKTLAKYFPWTDTNDFKAIPMQKQRKSNALRSPRDVHYANSLVRPEADAAPMFLTVPPATTDAATTSDSNSPKMPSILLTGLQSCDLTIYTYGSPRVGDTAFKELFDRLVPQCFRVVNGQDIIARMPRNVTLPFVVEKNEEHDTYNTANVPWPKKTEKKKQKQKTQQQQKTPQKDSERVTELNFAHVGKTVLIDPTYVPATGTVLTAAAAAIATKDGVWVEQETLSVCPLSQDGSLFLPNSVFANITSGNVSFFSSAQRGKKQSHDTGTRSAATAAWSLTDQVTKVTSETVTQLMTEMEKQLKPAVALAVENATKNVTEIVDKHLKQQQQLEYPPFFVKTNETNMNMDYETWKANLTAAEATWAKVTEDLVKRLRSNAPIAAAADGSNDTSKSSMKSETDMSLTQQWQVFERTLTDWKTAVSSSSSVSATGQVFANNSSGDTVSQQQQQQERWQQVMSLASSLGVDTVYLEREMALLSSIWERTAVEHHLEPSYYVALCRVSGCDELAAIATNNMNMKANGDTCK